MQKMGIMAAGLAVIALGWGVPAVAQAGAKPAKNIVQVAREAGQFTTLLKAVQVAGLTGALSGQGKGPLTVFAPTDAAFAALPAGTVEALLADPAKLRQILLYHVVAGEFLAAQVVGSGSLETLQGQNLTVSTAGGAKVNDSKIVATDIAAKNGVIHVIDAVLLPR